MTQKPTGTGDAKIQLDVQIVGREYKIACREHERSDLLEAVAFLDRRMREIRDAGKVSGAERIAVMAALNIANELLRERRAPSLMPATEVDGADAQGRIKAMQTAIDQAMAGQDKLF